VDEAVSEPDADDDDKSAADKEQRRGLFSR
jgi:hypothetical protein